jgi:hypothetical protein
MRALRTVLLAAAVGLTGLALTPATSQARGGWDGHRGHGYYGPPRGHYYRPPPPVYYRPPPPVYYRPPPPVYYAPPPAY